MSTFRYQVESPSFVERTGFLDLDEAMNFARGFMKGFLPGYRMFIYRTDLRSSLYEKAMIFTVGNKGQIYERPV